MPGSFRPAAASESFVTTIMSTRAHRLLALFGLVAIGCVVLFPGLDRGPFYTWDEGLYGHYGRNASFHGRWWHAVDEQGRFPHELPFSKPPLSLWLVAASVGLFGPSLFALRLPFTCAVLGVAVLLFAWGCRLERGPRGVYVGLTAGLVWLCSQGIHYYGRMAAIEPVLITFVLAALLAHAKAMDEDLRRGWLWAGLSGACVACAFRASWTPVSPDCDHPSR